jgi:hypothetical protein
MVKAGSMPGERCHSPKLTCVWCWIDRLPDGLYRPVLRVSEP